MIRSELWNKFRNAMKKSKFSPNNYWIERAGTKGMRSVGLRSFSDATNRYLYEKNKIIFSKVLSMLKIGTHESILDAGAGIGIYTRHLYSHGYKNIIAVDISRAALLQIDIPVPTVVASLEELTRSVRQRFHLVYCFDVLYHIIDDENFATAIQQLSAVSERYIIIHGLFPLLFTVQLTKHARFRKLKLYDTLLAKHGFQRIGFEPTSFVALRLTTYRFFSLAPRLFYTLDQKLVCLLKIVHLEFLASHKILIYEKSDKDTAVLVD